MLREWAYATSPYGLGLTAEQFWTYTPRELKALTRVHEAHLERWALDRAMFANAHRDPNSPPFEPGDFLGLSSYEQRRIQANEQRTQDEIALRREKRRQAGAIEINSVPEWALKAAKHAR